MKKISKLSVIACLFLLPAQGEAGTIIKIREAGLLGSGYDSATQTFRSPCVTGRIVYPGTAIGDSGLQQNVESKKILADMGLRSGVELSLEIIEAQASSEFKLNVAETDKSITANFTQNAQGKVAKLIDLRLNDAGKTAAQTADIKKIHEICGDSVVDTVDLTGTLIISLSIHFTDSTFKASFEGEGHGGIVDLFKVSGGMKTALEKYKTNASVSVVVTQIGGDVSKLANIFRAINAVEKADGKHVTTHIFSCNIDNLDDCSAAMDDVAAYARDDFSQQLNGMVYNENSPTGPAVTQYSFTPYSQTPVLELRNEPDLVNEAALLKRAELVEKFFILQGHLAKVDRLLNYTFLRPTERANLQAIHEAINNNIGEIVKASKVCRYNADQCVEVSSHLLLKPYDPEKIKRVLIFWDYCNLPTIGKNEKVTLDAIMTAAEVAEEDRKNCDLVWEVVSSRRELDLSNKKIISIAPLAGLEDLTKLDLSYNAISVSRPLRTLVNLKSLSLRNNKISDVGFVSSLRKLQFLDMAQNKVFDPDPISDHPEIKTLRLYDNPFSDEDSALHFAAPNQIISSRELCSALRAHVRSTRGISSSEIKLHASINLAPGFWDPSDPDNSPIDGWYGCPMASRDLRKEPRYWLTAIPVE
jgi:hypothetical protein